MRIQLSEDQEKESIDAKNWIRANKAELIKQFTSDDDSPVRRYPISYFMAGSPGAGKTETAKNLAKGHKKMTGQSIVHIDDDKIREMIPGYNGTNTDVYKRASALGVDILHDHVIKAHMPFILDTTFSNLKNAQNNIGRSIKHRRIVEVVYIHQNPTEAWRFAKSREIKEGRTVPKDFFIESLFQSRINADKIKQQYKKRVTLWLINKDFEKQIAEVEYNIERIDDYLKIAYNRSMLQNMLK